MEQQNELYEIEHRLRQIDESRCSLQRRRGDILEEEEFVARDAIRYRRGIDE